MKKQIVAVVGVVALSSIVALAAKDLATVNSAKITDGDLKKAISGFNEQQQKDIMSDANTRNQVLQNLIDQELLSQEGRKQGLEKTEEFKEAMDAFSKQYIANMLVQKQLGPKMSEGAAKDFYKDNKNNYSTAQVHAQHILVKTEEEARKVMQQTKQKDTDFQELAEKISQDPSAKNNRGDLGYFTRDRMVAEFTDAAFAAKKGDIVGPVKTAYGYHVIKVVDKKNGNTLGYDEVELRVKADLRQKLIRAMVSDLRAKAKITVTQ
ncbi:MAG: peptidylprolyl isomerase [Bacteriovoracia bacterium]